MAEQRINNRQLAHKLKCGETQVSKWVNGLRPGERRQKDIAQALKVKPEQLWP
jgi:transcriptional regulator with XRE-family HTH domain